MKYVSIGEASEMLGVAVSTMRRWEKEGRLRPSFRTIGGHRRYCFFKLSEMCGKEALENRKTIAYARVSSHDQKTDLERQKNRLEKFCVDSGFRNIEVMSDLGSGLNYNKKSFKKLLGMIAKGHVQRLILTHKDRLLRFGADIIFELCKMNQTEVIITEKEDSATIEQRLSADVIELMAVFSARLYGSRSHKNRKTMAA